MFYLAGIYTEPLRFRFDDGQRIVTISGEAVDRDGNPIPIGRPWRGLHHGLRYVLAAGGRDIYYNSPPRPRCRANGSVEPLRRRGARNTSRITNM